MDSSSFLSGIVPSSILSNDYISLVISKLRREIYEFLLRRKFDTSDSDNENEDEYNNEFDLTKYLRIIGQEHIQVVISELESVGWSTFLAYGNTCLFIYIGEQPARCRG